MVAGQHIRAALMAKPITHVATTDIADMLAPGPQRRMELPGFADEFVDFPHFIIRITDEIWHERKIEKCADWYAEDCVIHTLGGDIVGAKTVIKNTNDTLKAFPDRTLDADNVIWSDDGDGKFYSSHLITSKMTNKGASEFGPPTGKAVRIQTIAECLCQDNKVIEEWLVRDNLALCLQLGFDPDETARKQVGLDRTSGFDLVSFHESNRDRVLDGNRANPAAGAAAEIAANALIATLHGEPVSKLNTIYDFRANISTPGGEALYGPDQIASWFETLLRAITDVSVSIDHIAEISYLGHAKDVSIRWGASAVHTGDGRYGPATEAPIYILGVTQFRIMNGRIREATFIWDDIAVRRQVESARLSA